MPIRAKSESNVYQPGRGEGGSQGQVAPVVGPSQGPYYPAQSFPASLNTAGTDSEENKAKTFETAPQKRYVHCHAMLKWYVCAMQPFCLSLVLVHLLPTIWCYGYYLHVRLHHRTHHFYIIYMSITHLLTGTRNMDKVADHSSSLHNKSSRDRHFVCYIYSIRYFL